VEIGNIQIRTASVPSPVGLATCEAKTEIGINPGNPVVCLDDEFDLCRVVRARWAGIHPPGADLESRIDIVASTGDI